jgi:hypothetical protein
MWFIRLSWQFSLPTQKSLSFFLSFHIWKWQNIPAMERPEEETNGAESCWWYDSGRSLKNSHQLSPCVRIVVFGIYLLLVLFVNGWPISETTCESLWLTLGVAIYLLAPPLPRSISSNPYSSFLQLWWFTWCFMLCWSFFK